MNSFEMNKILGAILATCLGVVALNIASGAIFSPPKLAKPGYEIAVPDPHKPDPNQPVAAQAPALTLAELLAKADLERGQGSAQKCGACHTFDKGGKPGLGPNLWGVMGRAKGSAEGFGGYSPAMKAAGGQWTVSELFEFVSNPAEKVPGNFMPFGGIPRAQERADLMAYLNSLADNPGPLSVSSGTQRADLSRP